MHGAGSMTLTVLPVAVAAVVDRPVAFAAMLGPLVMVFDNRCAMAIVVVVALNDDGWTVIGQRRAFKNRACPSHRQADALRQ